MIRIPDLPNSERALYLGIPVRFNCCNGSEVGITMFSLVSFSHWMLVFFGLAHCIGFLLYLTLGVT